MRRRVIAVAAATLLVAAGSAALGASFPVETTVDGGTRAFTLKSATGADLTTITVPTAGSTPLLANVTDLKYSRTGYQVTTTMSDLYGYASGEFDCANKLAASSFSLDFLLNPISLADVKARARPVWDLSGTVSGAVATALGKPGETLPVSADDVSAEPEDRALSGLFSGVEDALPIKIATGTTGAFSTPASHSTCDPTPGGIPTTRSLMTGTQSNLSALFTWVEAAVRDAADQNGDGTITASELVASGAVDSGTMASSVRQALIDAGVDSATLDTAIAAGAVSYAQLFALLNATLGTITGLTGQSGTYLSLPKLTVSVPAGTAPGAYRGTLTVTLVDVP